MHSNGEKRVVALSVTLINRLKGMLIFDAETDFVRPGVVVRLAGPDIPADPDTAKLRALSAFITITVVLNVSVRLNSLSVSPPSDASLRDNLPSTPEYPSGYIAPHRGTGFGQTSLNRSGAIRRCICRH
ncbi:Uncharacterised protein [Escherichia coli]|uniref:Uncharacterized protein n=1 Tax=Escherichia coli TaxID=562 RepID=A0A377KAE5_ECOLX|nr:Uncharacterised protein [Escherichia coli]